MANRLGELELNEAATDAAGNWKNFSCFVWFRDDEIEAPDNWAILYTHHRDSGLLDQSNAAFIAKAMEPFTEGDDPDVVFESHNHWAVGHVDGFSIRVFDTHKRITDAFRRYHEIAAQLAEYPILDESDYSERETEATLENIVDAAWRVKDEYDLPEGWECDVYSWLSDNDSGEVENRDDQGGYPSEEALRAAFDVLGYSSADAVSV
jgi:hypothetical protein